MSGSRVTTPIDRTRPPATPPAPGFHLPEIREAVLPNGLTVVLVEDRRFPLIQWRLGFSAGAKHDPESLPGLTEAVAALLTEGTRTRTSREIAEQLAGIGGSLHASSSEDHLTLSGQVLAEHFRPFLDLAADVTLRASFPAEEVALYRQNRSQELLAQRAQPSTLANEKIAQLVYGGHPYSRLHPTQDSIQRLEGERLVRFRDRALTPKGAWLVLLGDLPTEAETLAMLGDALGGWEPGEGFPEPSDPFPASRRRVVLVDRPGSVQANIVVGRLGIDARHPALFPLLVANAILGGGASSRLFMNIREAKGYAYNVGSFLDTQKAGGSIGMYTQVRNDALAAALADSLAELERMAREPVTEEELANVQNYLSGTFLIRLETMGALAGQLLGIRLRELPRDYLETYTARVRSVTRDQIMAAARDYIDPARSAIVVVGDAGALRGALVPFGAVTVEKAEP
jgi:zinc protease